MAAAGPTHQPGPPHPGQPAPTETGALLGDNYNALQIFITGTIFEDTFTNLFVPLNPCLKIYYVYRGCLTEKKFKSAFHFLLENDD